MIHLLENQPVRALTWKEPFASLMFRGKIETRKWPTDYRGWVLICSGLGLYDFNELRDMCSEEQVMKIIEMNITPLHGQAIGIGRLVDCRRMYASDADKCFVRYEKDLYCHVYEDVLEIEPFHWKGTQGWRILNAMDIEKIKLAK